MVIPEERMLKASTSTTWMRMDSIMLYQYPPLTPHELHFHPWLPSCKLTVTYICGKPIMKVDNLLKGKPSYCMFGASNALYNPKIDA